MGARFRGDRQGHRYRPHGARSATAKWSATSRSARSPTKRPLYDRPFVPTPRRPQPLGRRAREQRHRRRPAQADGLARHRRRAAGSGSNTTSRSAPTRSSGRAATPRWCASTARRRRWRSPPTAPRAIASPTRIEGGKQAIAEAYRNLCAVGAKPLATTDCMNFGNPQRPEIMGQFVGCIEGMAEACRALDFPIVSGNVSLYNETKNDDGTGSAILPTPAIGGVGLLDDYDADRRRSPSRQSAKRYLAGRRARRAISASRSGCARSTAARTAAAAGRSRAPSGAPASSSAPLIADGRGQRRATTSRTAASRWRSPKWRWPAASARRSSGPVGRCRSDLGADASARIRARYVVTTQDRDDLLRLKRPRRAGFGHVAGHGPATTMSPSAMANAMCVDPPRRPARRA